MSKKIQQLKSERNLKDRDIKLFKRSERKVDKSEEERSISLIEGAVWLIPDQSVPFDAQRELKEIKPFGRPCLCLETPQDFEPDSLVSMAPGTSKPHRFGAHAPLPVLFAKVPPEDLDKDTYFLLYFSWTARQKNLIKHRSDLSASLVSILQNMQNTHQPWRKYASKK